MVREQPSDIPKSGVDGLHLMGDPGQFALLPGEGGAGPVGQEKLPARPTRLLILNEAGPVLLVQVNGYWAAQAVQMGGHSAVMAKPTGKGQ
jgi:hypothetical protein